MLEKLPRKSALSTFFAVMFYSVLLHSVEQKRESMLSLNLENYEEWNFLFLMAIFLIQWLRFIVVIGAQVAKVVRVICFL